MTAPADVARDAGFSLVEVLVSLVIVSMGILALASLLQTAGRHGKMGELRATATLLASGLADRIRANPAGARAGLAGYDLTETRFPSATASAQAACSRASPCGPSALAQGDVAAWRVRLRATLPNGSGFVRYAPAGGEAPDAVDVWVAWTDPGALAGIVADQRSGMACPPEWRALAPSVRCLHLPVALP